MAGNNNSQVDDTTTARKVQTPMNDERHEDGVGSVSGTGGEEKRVSWNSLRLRFAKDVEDIKEALDDQATRLGR